MVAQRSCCYVCCILLAASLGQAAGIAISGKDISASTVKRDGPWALYMLGVTDFGKCVVARTEPLYVKLKSARRRFAPSDCSKFYGFDARGNRVVFRAKNYETSSEETKYVLHYNEDKEWTLAKEDSDFWEKRQLFEQTAAYDGTWCLWYDTSICLKLAEHGTMPTFPKTTPPPTTLPPTTTTAKPKEPPRTVTEPPSKPTKEPSSPVEKCPSSCKQPACADGMAVNGGQKLVDGSCTKYCSQIFGDKRYCGEGKDYQSDGHVDCTGCAEVTCPAACSSKSCKPGQASNGGLDLVEGTCRARCSQVYGDSRYCGKGADYATDGSVDCASCSPATTAKPETTPAPAARRRRRGKPTGPARRRRRGKPTGPTRRRSSRRRSKRRRR